MTDSGRTPDDYSRARLPWSDLDKVKSWMEELERNDFWNVRSPGLSSSVCDYLVLTRRSKIHFIEWSKPDDIPPQIGAINTSLRQWAVQGFHSIFMGWKA